MQETHKLLEDVYAGNAMEIEKVFRLTFFFAQPHESGRIYLLQKTHT